MSLDELKKILPIPADPIDTDESVLAQNMKKLGVEFPTDYLEYSRVYGSGKIRAEGAYGWEFYSAFRPSLPEFISGFADTYGPLKDPESKLAQPNLFPEPGGLLPFGRRDDVYFTWKTEGSAKDWKVVVFWGWDSGAGEDKGRQEFDLNFSDFLVQMLTRKFIVAGFRTPWELETDLSFEPEVYGG